MRERQSTSTHVFEGILIAQKLFYAGKYICFGWRWVYTDLLGVMVMWQLDLFPDAGSRKERYGYKKALPDDYSCCCHSAKCSHTNWHFSRKKMKLSAQLRATDWHHKAVVSISFWIYLQDNQENADLKWRCNFNKQDCTSDSLSKQLRAQRPKNWWTQNNCLEIYLCSSLYHRDHHFQLCLLALPT